MDVLPDAGYSRGIVPDRVRIPGVEIGEQLGQGSYSVVYRALRGERKCALKVPRVRGRWTRWVYREAVALARLRHPALPRILEVGESEGFPYLLMELVEGEALADRLARGALSAERALDLGCQLADALRAVHEVGLVHRDVKPRNVIVEAQDRARLVDFGFAVPVGTLAVGDSAGTRRYSAPEQFRSPERVDARADLYALGRVLFECLTGGICADADAATSVLGLTTIGVAPALARIIGGLVAEAPDDRYPDATALLSELHRVRAGGTPRGPGAYEPSRGMGPLIGRDVETERFTRAWRDVGSSGGRVLLVQGVRGSGKTRYMRTCETRVREEGRGRSLECTCRPDDAPLSALRRLFESYFQSLERLPPQERAAAVTALRSAAAGPLSSLARVVAPGFAVILGGSTTAVPPQALAEGAAELLVRLARLSGPLLVCVDDLQWTDPLSLDVLVAVADRAHEVPLLVLAAARPSDGGNTFDRFADTGHRPPIHITLGPLEVRQSAAIIASHLGVASVDPAVVKRIITTADSTPVGILEVLGGLLDSGALRLRDDNWQLDVATADRVALPKGTLALFGRRVSELPPATRTVLEVASVLGSQFEDSLLAQVLDLTVSDVSHALIDGRQAGLLERLGAGRHAFCHDSMREMLLGGLDSASRKRWHQRAAECLSETAGSDVDLLHACAVHFAAGELHKAPGLAHRVARKAAEGALDRFDNEVALRLLEMARSYAETAGLALDSAFHRRVGEANLRLGALDQGLRAFEAALEMAEDPLTRAAILGRIAWVRRSRSEPDQAWDVLERAFDAIGVQMPTDEGPPPDGGAVRIPRLSADAKEVFYELLQQHARLGYESGKPARSLKSTMQMLRHSRSHGPSVALARAHATHGAVLAYLGRRGESSRQLATAQAMGVRLGDPATVAFCLQRRHVALAFDGKFDAALELLREYGDEYGPWLEVNEFCDTIASGDIIESVRGRASEAWSWIARSIDRLRRRRHTSQIFASYQLFRARAALASLGRSGQEGAWLSAQLESVSARGENEKAYYRMTRWGPQARYLLDTGNLGGAFEDLVSQFESEGCTPGASHPALIEYYVAVAQARISQCLHASADERTQWLAVLRKAASDLRAAARLPLYQAHSALADGYVAWFEGHRAKTHRLLARAESLAQSEMCPWVLWGVARARAHMLRERGKLDAAHDQARVAEVLAREHGALPRAQLICEEFELHAPQAPTATGSSLSSAHRSSQRARRQLASLLHVVRAPYGQLRVGQQGLAILDDLVRELGADRAFIVFDPADDARRRLLLGRTKLGESLGPPTGWRELLLRRLIQQTDPWGAAPTGDAALEDRPDRSRTLAAPLFLNERVVGAVIIERRSSDLPFDIDDHELMEMLAHQIPLGLELSRLLEERDQLQASLQQAQKMEVVGQLAGGIAHDINNMLHLVMTGLESLRTREDLDTNAREDLTFIEEGHRRAATLTGKLLSFSRQHPLVLASADLNHAIEALHPMMRRWVGKDASVEVVLDLDLATPPALTDVAFLDHALLNLVINSRDAIRGRGTVTISTRRAVLGEDAVRRGASAEGDYVVVEVTDTGEGIAADALPRIYDPFFTTKPTGKGTGFGLTLVYAFVKQCGGHIEVQSEVGQGTTFRMYLPIAGPAHGAQMTSGPAPTPPIKAPAELLRGERPPAAPVGEPHQRPNRQDPRPDDRSRRR